MTSYIYDMVDTWNAGATTFTAVKMNVTDTASSASSLLMDLQVGGSSRFKVSKSGSITTADGLAFADASSVFNTNIGLIQNRFSAASGSSYSFSSTVGAFGTPDVLLTRRAAANLRLGAADAATAQPQILSVQSVVAGTSNTAGANLTITGSQGTGNAAGGSIIFQVAPLGSSGSAQNALVDAATFSSDGRLSLARASAQLRFAIDGTFISGNDSTIVSISNKFYVRQNTNSVFLPSDVSLSWSSSTNPTNVGDTVLTRDAANTLALRNGTAAQEMRVYETTTGTIYKAILGNRQLIKIAGAAFDNGAGASAGTLTNAPAVGNPTKWIPIDDNGTTRHIPAW